MKINTATYESPHTRPEVEKQVNSKPALKRIYPAAAILPSNDSFLHKIQEYVGKYQQEEITIQGIANTFSFSRVQVFRKIKALTGQSPSRFIRAIRLEKAHELLCTTDHPISTIAYTVGFADPKYFTRVFAEQFGKPPSAMRSPGLPE